MQDEYAKRDGKCFPKLKGYMLMNWPEKNSVGILNMIVSYVLDCLKRGDDVRGSVGQDNRDKGYHKLNSKKDLTLYNLKGSKSHDLAIQV